MIADGDRCDLSIVGQSLGIESVGRLPGGDRADPAPCGYTLG